MTKKAVMSNTQRKQMGLGVMEQKKSKTSP